MSYYIGKCYLLADTSRGTILSSRKTTHRCIWHNSTAAAPNSRLHHFRRAMLCIARLLPACLFVCPSVTFVSCAKTNKDIFEVFSPSGNQAILVFPHQTGWRYFVGNGGVGCKGVWKKSGIFRPISCSISETVIVRWAHAARQFVSIEFCFHPYSI